MSIICIRPDTHVTHEGIKSLIMIIIIIIIIIIIVVVIVYIIIMERY